MRRKSQAAMEFLTTYAWAFIMIAIAIAAIVYFGVTKPDKVLPNRCIFGSEFQCLDYQISGSSDEFRLKLKNNAGSAITITSINLRSDGTTSYTCTAPSNLPITAMPSGNSTNLVFTSCNTANAGFAAGDKAKVLVSVSYYDSRSGSSYAKETQGEVLATVV